MLLVRPSLRHVVVINRDVARGAALTGELVREHGGTGVTFETVALGDEEAKAGALATADIVCTW
jgi:hypothetical protein